MPDLDSRNFDYAPVAPSAIVALAAAGIHTYGDLYRAPQAALDNDRMEPGACLEDIRGVGPKTLEALKDNLNGLTWDYEDSVKPVRAAACSAVASECVSERVVEEDEGDIEADATEAHVAGHDAAEAVYLAAKATYEADAVAAGATWQQDESNPTLGFELDADGKVVPDGSEDSVARVEVRYPGRARIDASVRPYDAKGSYVATFDHQTESNFSDREIDLYGIGEPVALNDARAALEAWLESDVSLVAVLSGGNRDRLVWAVVPDNDDLSVAAEAVDAEVGGGDHASYVEVRQIVLNMEGYDFYRVPTKVAETLEAGDHELVERFGRVGSVVAATDEN
ncbi:hypothetical protein [Aureimonas sp. SK2]|uniref:hypothetical protein n=1 Tax=Aureimonas sp. SK2 TaxID=3015992 RepID=UPI0024452182|nr:hypothetical protein [Aureimonas sp. SK2]